MKHLKILAASDRNNYGDLLFPLIIKKVVEKNSIPCSMENYGIIQSDLSWFGALPTSSYKQLIKSIAEGSDADIRIIVAGGEVLGGQWLNILRYISPFWNKVNGNNLLRRVINKSRLVERYYYSWQKSSRPFILDHPFFAHTEIAYNSVGALGVKMLLTDDRYLNYFKNVKVLSVRDNFSLGNFNSFQVEAKLVPDSALIMSDLFERELQEYVSREAKEIATSPYAFVQLGHKKGPDDLARFAADLASFSDKSGLRIVLCPIGLAMDHNDQLILSELAALNKQFIYYQPRTLYDIMDLLKHSKLYAGTSLHGIITAQSFGVPSVAFTEKIPKLRYYIETWLGDSENIVCRFDEFEKIHQRLINFGPQLAMDRLRQQKKQVYDNLSEVING